VSRVQSSAEKENGFGLPRRVLTELCSLNSELYLVGGPIRDALLHRPCHDWDFVCRHARQVARRLSRKLRATFVVLDEQNRIYRLVMPDKVTLDFAELQGKSIEEDLSRRDLTVNAMARVFPAGKIIDPFSGQRDLKSRTIRAVSEKAFIEDPIRLLRAYRFQAQFQFKIEPKTLRWIQKHHRKLSEISSERIREELLRLWKQPCSIGSLRMMDRVGLLSGIFPEVEACRRTAIRYYGKGGVLKHAFETVENLEWLFGQIGRYGGAAVSAESAATAGPAFKAALPLRRVQPYLDETIGGFPRLAWLKWAAFLHDIGKPATAKVIKGRLRFFEHEHVGAGLAAQASRRLRCSRQETHLIGLWVRNHMRMGNLAAAARITDKALSRYFRDLGEEGVGMVLVSLADHYTYLSKKLRGKGKDPAEKMGFELLRSFYDRREKILPKRLLDGHDLMKHLKIKPSPLVGRLLAEIQDAQAEKKVKTKEEAICFARKLVPQLRRSLP
jgi:putative nucleotidyltransferase with HDIG domain